MREYIITITAAAVAASLVDILAPREWEKYIRIIIGFLILSVIIAPIARFKNIEVLPEVSSFEVNDTPLLDSVSEQLRQNIEKDIEARLMEEFDVEATATVEIAVDENHSIRGVRAIGISSAYRPEGITKRLKEIYGCDRIEFYYE